jgi:serine/threonine-protein kinase HipA
MAGKKMAVFAHWEELQEPLLMGWLQATPSRGKEIFSFEYTREWLNTANAQQLDPDLQLYAGPQYLQEEKSNFGVFLDSSPDRWGRMLMRRREAVMAKLEGRKEKTLQESDYLLGVFDKHRMGAIRFKETTTGDFLNNDQRFATPPWTSLRELEYASLQLERDDIADDAEYMHWLNMLIAPGSSLGGARPKASVIDAAGNLWIAKFPSSNDDKDIGGWEMVVNDLAIKAGLHVAESAVQKFSGRHHTFLSKRFDSKNNGARIHFASSMTLLGYSDGADPQDGVSYLQLVEFLTRYGAKINEDLEELWRRIVFNICVKNIDDHLRNHGFLLAPKGWVLSPAYDINPVETGRGLSLNISENDNSLDLDVAISVAGYFRLEHKRAQKIIAEVQKAVGKWASVAQTYKISRNEQNRMAAAFTS